MLTAPEFQGFNGEDRVDRLFVPTLGATDWRRLLADPRKQWRQGRSAYELAVAWECARNSERGIPAAIATVLDTSPDLAGATLVIGLPELQVAMPGGGHASQTDLWVLLRRQSDLISASIEAKAGKPTQLARSQADGAGPLAELAVTMA